jgi:hypothetical protein
MYFKVADYSSTENMDLMSTYLCFRDLGWLWQWRRTGNRGMNAGAATLLMYLYSPDSYNI